VFIKKKKEELDDQFAVYKEREAPRFAANGGISIEGFEGEGLLKNVSVSGCCLESVTYVAITPGKAYQTRIDPGADIDMEPFTLNLLVSWTRSSEMIFEAGFSLEANKKDPRLEHYREQLQARGVQPEYGNMGQNRPG
jgi:hypothetical protein